MPITFYFIKKTFYKKDPLQLSSKVFNHMNFSLLHNKLLWNILILQNIYEILTILERFFQIFH